MLTDLQGSTQAWEKHPKAMRSAMVRHDAILASAVRDHKGELVEAGREGDSILAVFRTAATAAACALDIQKKFAAESWPEGLDLNVRVALHTGEAQLRQGHYFGPALNRCARLLAACHPGQILMTKATESMLADESPPNAELQDLGVHHFKDLARPEQVFQLNDLARPLDFPRIQSLPRQQTNMPHYLTNFVGRADELTALQALLASSRMVTLTGAGGSGKTRLAAELGWSCLDHWSDGVWWVELAPLTDPHQVPGAVVTALELPGRGHALDVIAAWLVARRAVLILDDCEHLVVGCAEFCESALQRCPELTIIATSREALGVSGEARWSVSSMAASEAVQLFEARARLVVPEFEVTTSNLQTVTQICERLDGMPLAIELAAARVGMMTAQEILSQLSDRFHLLTGGSRTAPERQQTMMATIDWSYRLLSEEEARLFRRLSVFRGGFTLESAHAVCFDRITTSELGILTGLVEKSMVVAERSAGSASRYRLLESQLAYAEDRLRELGELELMQHHHHEYFRDGLRARSNVRALWHAGQGDPEADWKARELGNLWAALGWARVNAADLGLSFAVDLSTIPLINSTQARRLLAEVLERSPEQGAVRATALIQAASLAQIQGDYSAGISEADAGLALARDLGDGQMVAYALLRAGALHQFNGDPRTAADMYEEAMSLIKGSDNLRLLTSIRNNVAIMAIEEGDYARARDILVECVAAYKSGGDVLYTATSLDTLATAQLFLSEHRASAASFSEALSGYRSLQVHRGVITCLHGLSRVAEANGEDERTLRLGAAANRISSELSLVDDPWATRFTEESLLRSRSRLGARKSEEAWGQGLAMSLNQAIDYALGDREPEQVVDPGPLSRRQREVAMLVAAGLTNREIAERLFIAERSAEGHVERIRNRLGVRSRTEVATWAVEHGLTAPQRKVRGTGGGPLPTRREQPS